MKRTIILIGFFLIVSTIPCMGRYYDPTIGRWLIPDPLAGHYPNISPYVYVLNNPLKNIDPNGKKVFFAQGASVEFKQQFSVAIQYLNKYGASGVIARLHARENIYYIKESSVGSFFRRSENTIYWNPLMGVLTTSGKSFSPSIVIVHEASHALQYDKNPIQYTKDTKPDGTPFKNKEEKRVILSAETDAARKTGEIAPSDVTRSDHSGSPIYTKSPTITEIDPTKLPVITLPPIIIEEEKEK